MSLVAMMFIGCDRLNGGATAAASVDQGMRMLSGPSPSSGFQLTVEVACSRVTNGVER